MPKNGMNITNTKSLKIAEIVANQTNQTKQTKHVKEARIRKRKPLRNPEFIIHRGDSTFSYATLCDEITKVTSVVTDKEKKRSPYPVLIMKPEVITVKWCSQPEPKPMTGFTSQGELSMTLNLLGYRRVGFDFLKKSVSKLRARHSVGDEQDVHIRPIRGPWTFKLFLP